MFLSEIFNNKTRMVDPARALKGRDTPLDTAEVHAVTGRPLKGPWPDKMETIFFGMGCFWGAERLFWQTAGVYATAVGYQGGITPNPTYQETVTGLTGHVEIVKVVYDPAEVSLVDLLRVFFEEHDPTQGMRQGNDVGTTYRSAIFTTTDEQMTSALASRDAYQAALKDRGMTAKITTEIAEAPEFYYAEEYHQQYLHKNPNGYCGLRGTGVSCPIPASAQTSA